MIDHDHDLATMLAGTRNAELASAVLGRILSSGTPPDPEVLECAAANRWGAVSPALRLVCARLAGERRHEARRAVQAAADALVAGWTGADSRDGRVVAAHEVVRASPEVAVAVARQAIDDGDAVLLSAALTARAMRPDDRRKILTDLSRGARAAGTVRQRLWRDAAVPAIRHCVAAQAGFGVGREARRLAGMLPSPQDRGAALAAIDRAEQARAVDRERLAGLLDQVTGEEVWVPIAGKGATQAAKWGGPAAVKARWQGAWTMAAQVDADAADYARRWHRDHWGVWGGQRKVERAHMREAVASV